MRQVDKLGCLKPGAFADLLVVDGNPLKDLGVLQEQGKHLAVIMKGGALPQEPAAVEMSSRGSSRDPAGLGAGRMPGELDTRDKHPG